LELPLPGSGATARRWQRLSELTETDVAAGRLAEAHVDSVAILDEPMALLAAGRTAIGAHTLTI
jgi:hypothetical protein